MMSGDLDNNEQKPIREFEFLSPVMDFVLGFTDFTDEMKNDQLGFACSVTNVQVDMPVEMALKVDDNGNVDLASAPPTQQIETTIFPVLHRMRLNLVAGNDQERE